MPASQHRFTAFAVGGLQDGELFGFVHKENAYVVEIKLLTHKACHEWQHAPRVLGTVIVDRLQLEYPFGPQPRMQRFGQLLPAGVGRKVRGARCRPR